jgi:hypothetical protein
MSLKYVSIAGFMFWVASLFPGPILAHAESTTNCPAGQYDMLDWMTLDSDLRASNHLTGSANPLYTTMESTW